ncbi:MAG TPA: T9SS type A sorting domain-containing protein [Saprospiraceae bacterium]|nr:T9SS type A sorting domain-containing protein [Saprospiraceae bacterium]
MSRLLAPFVHQSLVRPDGEGGLILTGADDVERYLSEKADGLYISRLGLPEASGNRIMVHIDPPVPLVKNAQLDDTWQYNGTISMTSPQSSREVRLTLAIHAEADATGELYSPTLKYDVLRERRDIEVTLAPGGAAVNPADLGLPPGFTSGRVYVFQSATSAVPVAMIQADAMDQVKQVEYISHPWAGTVVQHLPRRPDIFIYPNPSFGNVRFDFLNLPSGYYDLEIYNILGTKIRTERLYMNGGLKTVPIDLSRLKKGTYIYRLVDSQKNTIRSKRLVIITP